MSRIAYWMGKGYIGIGYAPLNRRQRLRSWLRCHWRWIRHRGSRDGSILYLPVYEGRDPPEQIVAAARFPQVWSAEDEFRASYADEGEDVKMPYKDDS